MNVTFEELYMFDPFNKTGRKISFEDGINVITSNHIDGTDRGKSVIMRSLYHCLGAEAHFEAKWEPKNKIYILKMRIGDQSYYMYRSADLYKFFDKNKELLFVATRSAELAEKLNDYTDFTVLLPNRNNNKLEITPPVYNYLPFYIDQDHYDGSIYSSFKNLGQYQKFKDFVLFYHLGIYNEEYFNLIRRKELLSDQMSEQKKRLEILQAMLCDIDSKLEVKAVSSDLDSLKNDVELYRREYESLLTQLNKSKSRLVELRNYLYDIEVLIREMSGFEKKTEKEIIKLQEHTCPECGSKITDTVVLRSKKYNMCEDAIVLKNELQSSLHSIEKDIEDEEAKYKSFIEQLNQYECRMNLNSTEITDILRYKALCDIREDLVNEKKKNLDVSDDITVLLTQIKKELKKYSEKKKEITMKYYELLVAARTKFGLYEIDIDKFKNMSTNFTASGSNRNIATVIWYLTVLSLRSEFNGNVISFPLVLDSPNNVETDDIKRHSLIEYILDCPVHQLIMSSIGFETSKYSDKKINIIRLENEKYSLLCTFDYEKYSNLLNELCDATLE